MRRTLIDLTAVSQRSARPAASHLSSRPPTRRRSRKTSPNRRRLKDRLGQAIQEAGLRKVYLRGQRQVIVGSYWFSRGFTRIRTSARNPTFTKHVEAVTPPFVRATGRAGRR